MILEAQDSRKVPAAADPPAQPAAWHSLHDCTRFCQTVALQSTLIASTHQGSSRDRSLAGSATCAGCHLPLGRPSLHDMGAGTIRDQQGAPPKRVCIVGGGVAGRRAGASGTTGGGGLRGGRCAGSLPHLITCCLLLPTLSHTGMACAWSLSRFPDRFAVEVWEALPEVGGVASTCAINGGACKVGGWLLVLPAAVVQAASFSVDSLNLPPSHLPGEEINDQVQGGAPSYLNNLLFFKVRCRGRCRQQQ